MTSTQRPEKKKRAAQDRSQPKEPVLIDVSTDPTANTPNGWSDIRPGSVVLVRDSHDEAWYEAIIQSVIGDAVQLKWRDYPGFPIMTRQRHQLGLMYPGKPPKSAA